jgi:ferredoxin
MKVFVDQTVCALNAECTYAAPDIFRVEGDELVWRAEVPPGLEQAARDAVDACPTLAIELVED